MTQSAPVLTEGLAAEPGFAALCHRILSGQVPLLDIAGPEPDGSLPIVVPFAWVDSPEPCPLVLVEIHSQGLTCHTFEPMSLPRFARRRLLKRLNVFVRTLMKKGPPDDFHLVLAADALEVLQAYADKEPANLRHAFS